MIREKPRDKRVLVSLETIDRGLRELEDMFEEQGGGALNNLNFNRLLGKIRDYISVAEEKKVIGIEQQRERYQRLDDAIEDAYKNLNPIYTKGDGLTGESIVRGFSKLGVDPRGD